MKWCLSPLYVGCCLVTFPKTAVIFCSPPDPMHEVCVWKLSLTVKGTAAPPGSWHRETQSCNFPALRHVLLCSQQTGFPVASPASSSNCNPRKWLSQGHHMSEEHQYLRSHSIPFLTWENTSKLLKTRAIMVTTEQNRSMACLILNLSLQISPLSLGLKSRWLPLGL